MKTLIFAVLCAVSLPAAATDLDYSYVDLAYSRQDNDFSADHGNGYRLDGSWGLGSSGFTLEGAYGHNHFSKLSYGGIAVTPENYRLGGGYHFPLSADVDFTTHVDFVHTVTTTDVIPLNFSFDQSHNGYLLGIGLRGKLTDALELDAVVDHDDVGFMQQGPGVCPPGSPFCSATIFWAQDGSETVIALAGRYRFTGPFGLGLEYRHSSLQGGQEWLLSGRWNF